MQHELEQALKGAGIDEFTPTDTVLAIQVDSRAFLAIDWQEQHAFDDMLERTQGGEQPWLVQ